MSFFRRAGALIARFFTSAADPTAVAGEFKLYSKVDGGVTQLYARSDDGTVYQLTPITFAGRAIVGAVDAAAQRDALQLGTGATVQFASVVTPLVTAPGLVSLNLTSVGANVSISAGDGSVTLTASTNVNLTQGLGPAHSLNLGQPGGRIAMYGGVGVLQGAAVADVAGGAVIDVECRAAVNAILARLRAPGFIAT